MNVNAWITACDMSKIFRLIQHISDRIYWYFIVIFCELYDHLTVLKYLCIIATYDCKIVPKNCWNKVHNNSTNSVYTSIACTWLSSGFGPWNFSKKCDNDINRGHNIWFYLTIYFQLFTNIFIERRFHRCRIGATWYLQITVLRVWCDTYTKYVFFFIF